MAKHYIPAYMRTATAGWSGPGLYGEGVQWGGFQRISPAGGQQPVTDPQERLSSSNIAVRRSNAQSVREEDLRESISDINYKQFRYAGMFLATLASAAISLGVSNIVVTSMTVMRSQSELGCFDSQNPKYSSLGPHSPLMWNFDWSWVSAGLWASVLVFVAGNLAGTIRKIDSTQSRAFIIVGLLSMIIMIPLCLALSILDTFLSEYCKDKNPAKFAVPIVIAVVSGVEFVIVTYILVVLWRTARNIPMEVSSDDPIQFTSYAGLPPPPAITAAPVNPAVPLVPAAPVNPAVPLVPAAPLPPPAVYAPSFTQSPKTEPNITVINLPPPVAPQPVVQPVMTRYPERYPGRYPGRYPPAPPPRWYPRPVDRPIGYSRNLLGARPFPRAGMFPSNLYPSMVYGGYRRNMF